MTRPDRARTDAATRRNAGKGRYARGGDTHRSWLLVGRVLAGSSLAATFAPALAAFEAVPDLPLGLAGLAAGAESSESEALSAAVLEDFDPDGASALTDLAATRGARFAPVSGITVAVAGSTDTSASMIPVSSEWSEAAPWGALRRLCCWGPASMSYTWGLERESRRTSASGRVGVTRSRRLGAGVTPREILRSGEKADGWMRGKLRDGARAAPFRATTAHTKDVKGRRGCSHDDVTASRPRRTIARVPKPRRPHADRRVAEGFFYGTRFSARTLLGAGRLSLVPAATAAPPAAAFAAGRLGRDAWVISSFGDIGDAAARAESRDVSGGMR